MINIEHSIPPIDRISFITSRPWYNPDLHGKINDLLNEIVLNTHIVSMPSDEINFNSKNLSKIKLFCSKKLSGKNIKLSDNNCINVDTNIDNNFNNMDIELIKTPFTTFPLKQSYCWANCEYLLKNKHICNIYGGYALSEDGFWRVHYWGIKKNGELVETTEPRLLYLGYNIDSSI
jgi:hypothetical protein